jgi:hypothetical protein
MEFQYSRHGLEGKDKTLERLLEILPGAISWTILIGMTILSFTRPILAAVIMIAFVLYWLIRMLHMNLLLIMSYWRFGIEKNTDWMRRIADVDRMIEGGDSPSQNQDDSRASRTAENIHRSALRNPSLSASMPPPSHDIYHIVIVPVIKESRAVVKPGILAIRDGDYPAKRILLVLAVEERASEPVRLEMATLCQQHRSHFLDILMVLHPSDVPGESRVKGANATFAARQAAEYLTAQHIPFENVIISCFDADTVPVHNYFSCLTYYFMITPFRIRTSYQPIPVYFNNIWDVPPFARLIDVGTSLFQIVESTDPKKLITFSSHSMSFKALVDIGYWPVDIISDDSAIFWKALLKFEGDYQVTPMPIAVSMDVVTGASLVGTFVNIYKQKRRWAWGVENFPIVMRGFMHCRGIPLYMKVVHACRFIDKFTSWSTWPFLLAFVAWLPTLFAGHEFATTTIYYAAPRIRSTILWLSSCGVIVCMITSMLLLPRERDSIRRRLLHAVEWVLIPAVGLLLSALPALDAQTRLMFGRYMEFWVTDKYRTKG